MVFVLNDEILEIVDPAGANVHHRFSRARRRIGELAHLRLIRRSRRLAQ
jgi:hypothetical protein